MKKLFIKEKNQFFLSSQPITSGQIVGSKYFENNCSDISEIITIIIIIMTANVLNVLLRMHCHELTKMLDLVEKKQYNDSLVRTSCRGILTKYVLSWVLLTVIFDLCSTEKYVSKK